MPAEIIHPGFQPGGFGPPPFGYSGDTICVTPLPNRNTCHVYLDALLHGLFSHEFIFPVTNTP